MFNSQISRIFQSIPLLKPHEILCISFGRRTLHNKKYWDKVLDPVLELLDSNYLILERPYFGHDKPTPNENMLYLDPLYVIKYLNQIPVVNVGPRDVYLYKYLSYIISIVDPKILIMHPSHPYKILFELARDIGVPSIVLQTGRGTKPPDGDIIFTWGDYYTNLYNKNSRHPRAVTFGYPFLEKFQQIRKKRGLVCIVEGKYREGEMQLIAQKLSGDFPDFEFVYLPHPHRRIGSKYKIESEIKIYREFDTFDLISKAEYIIGDWSTLMIEANYMGSKVYVRESCNDDASNFPTFSDYHELVSLMMIKDYANKPLGLISPTSKDDNIETLQYVTRKLNINLKFK